MYLEIKNKKDNSIHFIKMDEIERISVGTTNGTTISTRKDTYHINNNESTMREANIKDVISLFQGSEKYVYERLYNDLKKEWEDIYNTERLDKNSMAFVSIRTENKLSEYLIKDLCWINFKDFVLKSGLVPESCDFKIFPF